MALIKCEECGAQISDGADKCPHCGAKPPKKTSLVTWIIGGIFAFAIGSAVMRRSEAPAPKTPEQLAAEQRKEAEFQGVVVAVKLIRSKMKDPSSFELKSAGMTDKGAICIEYSAKNGFNARVPEYYTIAAKSSGATAQLWNAHCAGQPIKDYTYAKHAL